MKKYFQEIGLALKDTPKIDLFCLAGILLVAVIVYLFDTPVNWGDFLVACVTGG